MIAEIIGTYASPLIVAVVCMVMLVSSKDLGTEFVKGAREGLATSVRLLPSLIMLVCGVRMLCESGTIDLACRTVSRLVMKIGVPAELIPVIIVRPFSGSAATAVADNLFRTVGPDTFAGRCASVLMGSSDTIVYTLAMYFGAAEIKKTRYAMPASFIVLLFCIVVSVTVTRIFFCG